VAELKAEVNTLLSLCCHSAVTLLSECCHCDSTGVNPHGETGGTMTILGSKSLFVDELDYMDRLDTRTNLLTPNSPRPGGEKSFGDAATLLQGASIQ
jgi:hypothetical protein